MVHAKKPDKYQKKYTEWKKPDQKEYIPYDFIYLKFSKTQTESIVNESKSVVAWHHRVEEWEGGTIKEHKDWYIERQI